jgi:type II secretory pathway component GspD/PulD (secretin)
MRSMMVRVCAGMVLAAAGVMAAFGQVAPVGGKTAAAGSDAPARAQPAQQAQQEQQQQQTEGRGGRRGALDVSSDATVRVFAVKNTRAGELHRILESVMAALGPMRLTTDERSNALIVAADEKTVLPKVEALLAALDRPVAKETQATEAVVNVPLNDAHAKSVAMSLERLLSEPGQRGPGLPPPTRVVADESGNSIWLAGEKSRVEQYADYARQMDKGSASRPNPRRELRYYSLKNADARALGQTVGQTSMVMGLEVPIVADGASDTLIAFGTKEEHEIIADLVSKLDVAPRHGGKMVEEAAPVKKGEPK